MSGAAAGAGYWQFQDTLVSWSGLEAAASRGAALLDDDRRE